MMLDTDPNTTKPTGANIKARSAWEFVLRSSYRLAAGLELQLHNAQHVLATCAKALATPLPLQAKLQELMP